MLFRSSADGGAIARRRCPSTILRMVPLPSLRDREDRQRPLPTPRRTPSQGNSIPHQPPRGEPTRQQREIFGRIGRSEEHTSELQSLMRISYAVFCLKKKNNDHRS